jgi:hypothetical protein
MANDKTLSERIITRVVDGLHVLQWKAMGLIVSETTSLVNEYREVTDGIGTVFSVVGYVWNIYSSMEKARRSPRSSRPWSNKSPVPVISFVSPPLPLPFFLRWSVTDRQ